MEHPWSARFELLISFDVSINTKFMTFLYRRKGFLMNLLSLTSIICFLFPCHAYGNRNGTELETEPSSETSLDVVLVKIGGSSITNKSKKETLDTQGLEWFAKSLGDIVDPSFKAPQPLEQAPDFPGESGSSTDRRHQTTFIVIHGAGSFGHFQAKEFGLKGPTTSKSDSNSEDNTVCNEQVSSDSKGGLDEARENHNYRYQMQGLAETRRSVQQLNQHVVSSLITHGSINAVGISPCFGIPHMQADANNQTGALFWLETVLWDTIQAGLIPVIHGDACLHLPTRTELNVSSSGDRAAAAILSGDILMEVLGRHVSWISRIVFITDVDGVFTKDPRIAMADADEEPAELLREIAVDRQTGDIILETTIEASSSSHTHDVTGGLKASR